MWHFAVLAGVGLALPSFSLRDANSGGAGSLQPTQIGTATLASPTIRRILIHYFELSTFKTYSNAMEYCM